MSPEEREELLAGYALGSLSEPDRVDAERLVRNDPTAAREVEGFRELTDLIALSAPLRYADPALRSQVIGAARRSRSPWRRGPDWKRWLPAAGLAAALAIVTLWAVSLHGAVGDLKNEQAALAAVVAADAKRLDQLDDTAAGTERQTNDLGVRLETVLRDQQTVLAVQADPNAKTVALESTSASHGGTGAYLWSQENAAGVLIVDGLPPLPVGAAYKVWLEDRNSQLVLASTFTTDGAGGATVALDFEEGQQAVRLYLVASNPDGSDGPVVLKATLISNAFVIH